MPANSANSRASDPDQTQLNILIDASLHHRLRVAAVLERMTLREYTERLIRQALPQDSPNGKPLPVDSGA